MATYEYNCEKCGVFELQQSMKDDPLDHCPTCKINGVDSGAPKRLISGSSFILGNGGVGWAKDKYSAK